MNFQKMFFLQKPEISCSTKMQIAQPGEAGRESQIKNMDKGNFIVAWRSGGPIDVKFF